METLQRRFGFLLHIYYGAPCSPWACRDFIVCGRGGVVVVVEGGSGGAIYESIYMQRATHVRLVSIGGCHLLVEKQIKVDH